MFVINHTACKSMLDNVSIRLLVQFLLYKTVEPLSGSDCKGGLIYDASLQGGESDRKVGFGR